MPRTAFRSVARQATRSERASALVASGVTACSVLGDHHVGCFDDGVGGVAAGELQVVDRLVRDGRRDDGATADVDPHVGCRRTARHVDHAALDHVTGAALHTRPTWLPRLAGDGYASYDGWLAP